MLRGNWVTAKLKRYHDIKTYIDDLIKKSSLSIQSYSTPETAKSFMNENANYPKYVTVIRRNIMNTLILQIVRKKKPYSVQFSKL